MKPTKREVLAEMGRGAKHYFNKKREAKAIRIADHYVSSALFTIVAENLSWYAIPSTKRIFNEGDNPPIGEEGVFPTIVGVLSGGALGTVLLVTQALGYMYYTLNDHPEVLAIPFITNAGSYVYEKARSAKNRLNEGLEDIANNA